MIQSNIRIDVKKESKTWKVRNIKTLVQILLKLLLEFM